MTETSASKSKLKWRHLIWCGLIIGLGTIIFLVLSTFGVFRYWQMEKQPQGETDLRFTAVDLPFADDADLDNSLPFLASAAIDIGGNFGSLNLNLPLADNTTPLSIGLADINQDGLADMYVAGYIKIDLIEGETNFDKTNFGNSERII